uniref:Venom S1 protease 7 n=2 Tax=Panheteroptera TaxID=33351 RepID=A0A2K8JRA8_9HEMI|nr:venom S1 protease 7 [Lethocerus distinctifemur]
MKLILAVAVVCLAGLGQCVPKPYDFSYVPNRASPEVDSSEAGQFKGPRGTNCSCGWTYSDGGRIVGGKEAKVNQYPYMAGIGYVDPRNKQMLVGVFCGGTIVTEFHVLTAAHCTYEEETYDGLAVTIGDHDISRLYESKFTTMHEVANIVEHPLWSPKTLVNDVALIVLKTRIAFNAAVGPVCLPNRLPDIVGQKVKVIGWGDTKFYGDSNVLLKVNLKVLPLKVCAENYPKKPIPLSPSTQLCTFSLDKDSCQGDSGGPVTWLDPDTNRFTLVGIVSYGTGCATMIPGVNTLVSHFMPWIQKTIKETTPVPVSTCAKV